MRRIKRLLRRTASPSPSLSNHPRQPQRSSASSEKTVQALHRLRLYQDSEDAPTLDLLELQDNTAAQESLKTTLYAGTVLHDRAHVIQGDVYGNVTIGCPTEQVVEAEEDAAYKALLDSLSFPHMDSRLRNVRSEMLNTCEWLFNHDQFTTWTARERCADHHGLLSIKGKPGSGKSTIMRTAYYWTQKHWPTELVVSYFFNGRAAEPMEKSSLGLYRSLTYQVLLAVPEARSKFTKMFLSKLTDTDVEQWTAIELQEYLRHTITGPEACPVNVFIDALDEGAEDDVRQLITYLEDLTRAAASHELLLRICVSSRHYPHIGIHKGLTIVMEEQAGHKEDIDRYIRTVLPNEEADKDESAAMRKLHDEVSAKSNGVFLWVVLVIPMLKKVYDKGGSLEIEATRNLLSSLPAELDELFARILARTHDDAEQCVSLLQCVLFARRNLSPDELYTAVTCTSSMEPRSPSTQTVNKFLLNCSRGLVEVTKSQPPTMQFIHETVRGFLLSDRGLCQIKTTLATNIAGLSHDDLKIVCVRCLKRCYSTRVTDNFLPYAVINVFKHANTAQSLGIDQKEYLDEFLTSEDKGWESWIFWENWRTSSKEVPYTVDTPLLYVVAELNLVHLVRCLAVSKQTANTPGGEQGNALRAACVLGHTKVVKILLQQGADLKVRYNPNHEAQYIPTTVNNIQVLRLLIEHGIALPPGRVDYILWKAISDGDSETVALALEISTDTDVNPAKGKSPLVLACEKRQQKIVQQLLNKGAKVDDKQAGLGYFSALETAVRAKHEEIIRILFAAGADPNANGCEYGALASAFAKDDIALVRRLLESYSPNRSEPRRSNPDVSKEIEKLCTSTYGPSAVWGADAKAQSQEAVKPFTSTYKVGAVHGRKRKHEHID